MSPEKTVQKIHAVVLSGGSAFGLEADSGVMNYLAKQGAGFPVGDITVPIVCGAVLFDLSIGSSHAHPDIQMGYLAASRASDTFPVGCYGAGTGASVGKLRGFAHAMKSGAGYAEFGLPGGLYVGATWQLMPAAKSMKEITFWPVHCPMMTAILFLPMN